MRVDGLIFADDKLGMVHEQMAARAVELIREGKLTRSELISIGPLITYTQEINRVLRELMIE